MGAGVGGARGDGAIHVIGSIDFWKSHEESILEAPCGTSQSLIDACTAKPSNLSHTLMQQERRAAAAAAAFFCVLVFVTTRQLVNFKKKFFWLLCVRSVHSGPAPSQPPRKLSRPHHQSASSIRIIILQSSTSIDLAILFAERLGHRALSYTRPSILICTHLQQATDLMLSSKLRVLVTRAVFPSVIERLSQHFIVESNPDDVLWDREELLRRAEDKDGVFVFGTERVDAELLSRCPRLRIAANMTVGYNNFDIPAMTQARVLGTNTPDVLTETTVLLCCISPVAPVSLVFFFSCVTFLPSLTPACPQADFGFALLMATARRVTESEHFLRAGLWTRWRYDMYYSSSFPHVPTSHSAVTVAAGLQGARFTAALWALLEWAESAKPLQGERLASE